MILTIGMAGLGAMIGSVMGCVPGLHVYNLMGLVVVMAPPMPAPDAGLLWPVPLVAGMVVGYSMTSAVPAVFLAAPDESMLFTVNPGQKYLMKGRGFDAVLTIGAGALIALWVLLLIVAPLAPLYLPCVHHVLAPHTHWILWCVISFMLLSEWPKGGGAGPGRWKRLADGWRTPGAGLLTFLLTGLLGFVLMYRPPVPAAMAFQNLMPAFVGLFALPWLLLNMVAEVSVPPQNEICSRGLNVPTLAAGTLTGVLGGGFAAFFPVVTGGIGSLLAGHATQPGNDRVFLVAQGASKMTYYAGALLLLFVPSLHISRGGGAMLVRGWCEPRGYVEYGAILSTLALAGAVSFLLLPGLTRLVMAAMTRFGCRRLSVAALVAAVIFVGGMTGWRGILVMTTAAGMGLFPVLSGSRRLNGLGIILLPMACRLSGVGDRVAGWLGLM